MDKLIKLPEIEKEKKVAVNGASVYARISEKDFRTFERYYIKSKTEGNANIVNDIIDQLKRKYIPADYNHLHSVNVFMQIEDGEKKFFIKVSEMLVL